MLFRSLGHVVSSVQHDAKGVIVATNKGLFTGACLLVTLPLGVLKSGQVSFSPALPADKQQAISRLCGQVLQAVDGQISSAVQHCLLDFASKDSGATELTQRVRLIGIA